MRTGLKLIAIGLLLMAICGSVKIMAFLFRGGTFLLLGAVIFFSIWCMAKRNNF